MFIRYFATTDEQSPVSAVALAYLRSLVRIAPVRVIDPGRMIMGLPDGEWGKFAGLFATPMVGPYVNVVCTEPSRWTWMQHIDAPKEDKLDAELEHFEKRLELYTQGVRNVLLVAQPPTNEAEVRAANRYECVLVATPEIQLDWGYHANGSGIVYVPVPVKEHRLVRIAVLGHA